ncbi:MAG: DUF305 domain-containing protein [Pseudonocardia sp.]|nr:DUF305 domain-containing protein [Pseudonocardia sp.]
MVRPSRWWVIGLLTVAAVLPSCGAPAPPDAGPPVLVPGRPGEPARSMPGAEAAQRRAPVPVSPADLLYVERMIPHHEQALTMAALAAGRAADPQIVALAERINASQAPEIAVMQAWLERQDALGHPHDEDPDGGHPHDGSGMPGMATPTQLDALAAAGGPEFDRQFVELMTAHHLGAIAMASDVLVTGTDITVSEMAQDVTVTQSVEIDRMRALPAG